MKFIIVLACLMAVAYANENANVLKSYAEVNPDSYKYEYELDNHIRAIQNGVLHDKDSLIVNGEFEWVSPEGNHIKVEYKADEYGYHPIVHI